ncbi:MAG: methyltransferase domain-containing protein [Gammaproteobacteria bacterium]|nr:methyltransferase domain-containing protein [Gammaproteobacteria bacterium]MBU1654186.1 methyltransferase domain-containing protein [Gammaproteobacteria bacterium]MBU1961812.1 methyltransferase domain-containing protein [Gammaproteobacteria bacterium]
MHDNVKHYYGERLSGSGDLRTDACCDPNAMPAYLKPLLADIHPEVSGRYYGCGLVAPDLLEGLRVLDLGCGSGRDVYLLSRLVGETGEVVGVDMTAGQLAVAERHREYHRERYGHARSNVRFLQGEIERLDRLGLEAGSFDLIVSNCVINLSPDKLAVLGQAHALLRSGGELYFSDVYADRRLPAELSQDPVLHGECLAGALYWNDFLQLARAAGFTDPRLVEDRPLGIEDPAIEARLAPARFFSATYRLFKLAGLEPACEDYGQAVAYRGSLPRHPGQWRLDKHHLFPAGKVVPVCGNTRRMLRETRFSPHFDLFGEGTRHLGIFDGCGTELPFDTEGGAAGLSPCC